MSEEEASPKTLKDRLKNRLFGKWGYILIDKEMKEIIDRIFDEEFEGLVAELQKRRDSDIKLEEKKPTMVMGHFLTGKICGYGEVLVLLGAKETER